jgi:TPR repeat protein
MGELKAGLQRLILLTAMVVASTATAQTGSVVPCPLERYRVPQWASDRTAFRQRLESDLKFAYQAGESDLALAILCAGAAAGEPFAEMALAAMVAEGKLGLSKDPALARRWLERAAARGDAQAQYLLYEMYLTGRGGPVRIAQAMDLLRASATSGYIEAKFMLAVQLITGDYVPRDLKAARQWLREAAQAAHPRAVRILRDLEQETGK